MKINNKKYYKLNKELKYILNDYRIIKNFNSKNYIEIKTEMLNNFFKENNISKCVIGISGGIDSAVVLGLLNKVKQKENSILKEIYPVLMPSLNTKGTTNQLDGLKKAKKVCKKFNLKPIIFNISNIVKEINKETKQILELKNIEEWEQGQLIPNLRVPIINFISTIKGNSIIVGTTNKSEGAYIGFFGKYSDAMVDIQPITDLYKSEVIKVAKELKVPKSIIKAKPRGDVYNNKTDEEMFGCSYDALELYLIYKKISYSERYTLEQYLDKKSFKLLKKISKNLENFHQYNKHKYKIYSQALHFDIYPQTIKNGWKYKNYKKELQ